MSTSIPNGGESLVPLRQAFLLLKYENGLQNVYIIYAVNDAHTYIIVNREN